MAPAALRIVRDIDCRIEPYDWAFATGMTSRIDSHWAELRRDKPGLFDGRVLLSHRLHIEGDCLRGAYFETAYRNFLSWRDFGSPGGTVMNGFAMAALVSADGAFMLGEMSAGTANAGRLYFPAGTPEPGDAGADGRIDFEANILRELEEETGLRPGEVSLDPTWTIVMPDRPMVACMRVARSSLDAAALDARLAAHNQSQDNPELSRFVAVHSTRDFDRQRMPDFMLDYLGEAFVARQAR